MPEEPKLDEPIWTNDHYPGLRDEEVGASIRQAEIKESLRQLEKERSQRTRASAASCRNCGQPIKWVKRWGAWVPLSVSSKADHRSECSAVPKRTAPVMAKKEWQAKTSRYKKLSKEAWLVREQAKDRWFGKD